jgi:hypothetical protein
MNSVVGTSLTSAAKELVSGQRQKFPFCLGGHGTVPYEQKTQQSPVLGLEPYPAVLAVV